MSRLNDELLRRSAQQGIPRERTPDELAAIKRFDERIGKFKKLLANKEFAEYLQLEAEMNDPKIVIAHKCTDPVCESLKQKIRDFWNRQRVLEKVSNGAGRR